MLGCEVSVSHRHLNIGVAQDFLQIKNISAVHHIFRSKAVSQVMEANFIGDTCFVLRFLKTSIDVGVFGLSAVCFVK